MNRSTGLSHEDCQIIRENLTLELNSADAPFALTENEKKFGPDDWAWLFLSLNQKYQLAYSNHAKLDTDPKIAKYLLEAENTNVQFDHDGSCRNNFGLAAWLSPTSLELPKLKNEDDSWFAPLRSVIPHDHCRSVINTERFEIPAAIRAMQRNAYPYNLIEETPFGSRITPINRQSYINLLTNSNSRLSTSEKRKIYLRDSEDLGNLAFAIDCSVPPDAQIANISALANRLRDTLMADEIPTNDNLKQPIILEIKDCDIFKGVIFETAKDPVDDTDDCSDLWRSVYINALGPIVTQTDKILRELRIVHKNVQEKKGEKSKQNLRFRNSLNGTNDSNGGYGNGGHYLKCLFIIAELASKNHDANQIAKIIGINSKAGLDKYSWCKQLHENIEDIIEDGDHMCQTGYRSLIHAQKPDIKYF